MTIKYYIKGSWPIPGVWIMRMSEDPTDSKLYHDRVCWCPNNEKAQHVWACLTGKLQASQASKETLT